MANYTVTFHAPQWLWLLLVIPVLWWFSARSLAGLGRWRRWLALLLRTAVLTLVIGALAEPQWVRTNDRLTVIFLVDQSLSIPPERRQAIVDYVKQASGEPNLKPGDRSGLIAFARDALPVTPPVAESVPVGSRRLEVELDPESTNLAAAMRMAQATFPEDGARRIVIVTDGNENIGSALEQAQKLADDGVGIDVVPIRLTARAEVAVEKITATSDVRRGQPFQLRAVLDASLPEGTSEVRGRLQIIRRRGDEESTLNPQPEAQAVTLQAGKNVFTFRETIEQPDFYRYEARFIPERPADDTLHKNNTSTTFTHVRGRGQVLFIKDWHLEKGEEEEFKLLVERLRAENMEVTVRTSDKLFTDLAELQRYDTVVLANVPRTSGSADGLLTNFSDEQIAMLVQNTQQLGAGLVMLGGVKSFGSGGWTGTELEKAMPVDFQISNAKAKAVGALVMIMHASEMPEGNFWQKKIAQEALKALGPEDYCGVIHWNGNDEWLWGKPIGLLKVGARRNQWLAALDTMTPGDMPQFDPAMQLALNGFKRATDAAVKQMIIISDGDPVDVFPGTLAALNNLRVRVTTVGVATHGVTDKTRLQNIAAKTGGKFYNVTDPNALPKIYQREVRQISRSLVYENTAGFTPQVRLQHEILKGIDGDPPPITGFVMTKAKEQAEILYVSPQPVGEKFNTILAAWVYGLGKTVALTTDGGDRWAKNWSSWPHYNKLYSQLIRWSMRPSGDQRNYSVATEVKDGRGRVVITALDEQDRALNLLDMTGVVVGPNLKPVNVRIQQTAPGRYIGEFDAHDAGSYMLSVLPEPGKAPILSGTSVGYSAEFRDRVSNEALIRRLASLTPKDGPTGQLIETSDGKWNVPLLAAIDVFRHDLPRSTSREAVWHLVALAGACLFFWDVFVRRVAVHFDWLRPLAIKVTDFVLRRKPAPAEVGYIERLRARKQEVAEGIDQRRAATRFEPTGDATADAATPDADLAAQDHPAPSTPQPGLAPSAPEEEDYTARLRRAKEQARRQPPPSSSPPSS